ncbi:MAG: hypothetical protein M3680_30060 [Myxococcota bacterium]|nr:hypothetical protein [Myxococcota bacterium]
MCEPSPEGETAAASPDVVATLVANHREFLRFVERRVGNRDTAEEILQGAFVKNLDKLDTVRETAIGWFSRVLRNAIIDHHRRTTVDGEPVYFASDSDLYRTSGPAPAFGAMPVAVPGVNTPDSSSHLSCRTTSGRSSLRRTARSPAPRWRSTSTRRYARRVPTSSGPRSGSEPISHRDAHRVAHRYDP